MKTYPYQTPDGIIELVEKREYDTITLLAHDLANLRAEDMATIKEMRAALESEESTRNYIIKMCVELERKVDRLIQAAKGES
jgi:hypothetical protein